MSTPPHPLRSTPSFCATAPSRWAHKARSPGRTREDPLSRPTAERSRPIPVHAHRLEDRHQPSLFRRAHHLYGAHPPEALADSARGEAPRRLGFAAPQESSVKPTTRSDLRPTVTPARRYPRPPPGGAAPKAKREGGTGAGGRPQADTGRPLTHPSPRDSPCLEPSQQHARRPIVPSLMDCGCLSPVQAPGRRSRAGVRSHRAIMKCLASSRIRGLMPPLERTGGPSLWSWDTRHSGGK